MCGKVRFIRVEGKCETVVRAFGVFFAIWSIRYALYAGFLLNGWVQSWIRVWYRYNAFALISWRIWEVPLLFDLFECGKRLDCRDRAKVSVKRSAFFFVENEFLVEVAVNDYSCGLAEGGTNHIFADLWMITGVSLYLVIKEYWGYMNHLGVSERSLFNYKWVVNYSKFL